MEQKEKEKGKKYIVSLTDGGTQALAFQLGAIAGMREVGILKDVRAFVASGSGCVLATLLMKNIGEHAWLEFCSSPLNLLPTAGKEGKEEKEGTSKLGRKPQFELHAR